MDKNALWKWLLLIAMVCGSLAMFYPPSGPNGKVQLGLDLEGGTSFIVEIDKVQLRREIEAREPGADVAKIDEIMKDDIEDGREIALEVIRNRVDSLGIAEPIIYSASYKDQERIIVQLPGIDKEKRELARELIESVAVLEFRMVHEKSQQWTDDLFAAQKAPKGFMIGTAAPYKHYVRDTAAVKKDEMDRNFYERLKKFEGHAGTDFMLVERKSKTGGATTYTPYYVEIRPQLKGNAIENAGIQYNQMTHTPHVTLELDNEGAKRFAKITRDHAPGGARNMTEDPRQLGIVLDGNLRSAPNINEEISGGNAQITGSFSVQEAMQLANILRSGSLPVPVRIVQTRTVDPSLGKDSIDSGVKAAGFAFAAVIVFMLLYYMKAGLVADMALLVDMLLLPLGLVISSGFLGMVTGGSNFTSSSVGLPTLTLPGIAGIVLTIGMAVDANVLIFERIREEMRAGKTLKPAIKAGYEKAFSTIFDANLTTLITAVILFAFGSGPIKGFAVTLTAGILVSMMVVLVYTRMFFDVMTSKFKMTSMKMMSVIKPTNINFVGMRYIALTLSVLIILGTWGSFIMNGVESNLGVDFTGGTSLLYRFEEKQSVDSIRDVLTQAGVEGNIQYQAEMVADADGKVKEYLELRIGEDDGEKAKAAIASAFGEYGFEVSKEDQVRGQVGDELRRKGIYAIIWALVGIVIYVTIRFEFGFAMGAIVALAHDVLITVGIYCLFGRQISLTVVAALLTIVGYSVNDTIVVFDRIREDLKLMKGKPFKEIANLSINQTLSRTILTSITTLLSVTVLFVFGGGAINDFALALLIGIAVGTYSSIFVATPMVLLWHRDKKPAKEGV